MLKTPASLSAALLTGQGGHVEEHLERGPGLEALAAVADGRQVDLRLLVVLAADHGHDLAGPGVDAGQRPVDPGAALLAVLAGPAGERPWSAARCRPRRAPCRRRGPPGAAAARTRRNTAATPSTRRP